jgi:hypothetical protein
MTIPRVGLLDDCQSTLKWALPLLGVGPGSLSRIECVWAAIRQRA